MVYFKENYNFFRFQRGSSQARGVQLFQGGGGGEGVPMLISIEIYRMCFSRGGGGGGVWASGSGHAYCRSLASSAQVFSCNGSFSIALETLQNMMRYMILDILSGSTLNTQGL